MKLYKINGEIISSLSSITFKLEKDIQSLIEKNLEELFNIQFVKSELTIKNFRIDTLGYNKETNSFVIIEYKKERNFSVIDQGYTYLSLLLNHKAEFVLEYNENTNQQIKRDDVDWSQSKVIFISPSYTEYQKHSVNFRDVPFELWEIKQFENNLLSLTQQKNTSTESISSVEVDNGGVVKEVTKEIKVYTEDYHFERRNVNDTIKELYSTLKDRITGLGEIDVVPRSTYIGFKRRTNFVDIDFQKGNLWLWINLPKGKLDDPKELSRDISSIGHYGNGDYELKVFPDTDLDYVMFLINQSYKNQE
jgi:predicted transport protein